MKHEPTMMRINNLMKTVWIVLLPAVLTGILIFQILKCGSILDRRNSYLLENLPGSTDYAWDALSGSLFPKLYAVDDQPGGIQANRLIPFGQPAEANAAKSGYQRDKSKWTNNLRGYQNDYRDAVLIPGMPSFAVHYFWCGDGHFELSHYITILSALHQLRPDKLIIHYLVRPRVDPNGYWRWLEDLERDIVLLSLKPLENPQHCSHDLSAGVKEDAFPDAHGVFLLGDVAITNLTRPDVIKTIAQSFLNKPVEAIELNDLRDDKWGQSQVFIASNSEPYHVSQSPGRAVITCPTISEFNTVKDLKDTSCVSMQSYVNIDELFNKDERFFRYARGLLYGSPDPFHALKSHATDIPSIYHIILREGSSEITPLIYISIKSAYVNAKIDTVYVHSHQTPSGELWYRLQETDKLSPTVVPIASFDAQGYKQAPMTYLLYTLLQHGGIANFGDVIFVKQLSPLLKSSAKEAIASLHRSRYRQKHRTLNTAVLAAAPGSEFIKEMLGMIHQAGISWPDISPDDVATHISEVKPHSLLINSQLTSHQECEGLNCLIAGGHDAPQMVYTARLIWKHREPKTLQALSEVQGPLRKELIELIR